MAQIIRRMTIFTLIMALFAIAFASLAVNPDRGFHRVTAGNAYATAYR